MVINVWSYNIFLNMQQLTRLITENIFSHSNIVSSQKNDVELFVSSQIKNSPSYIRLAIEGLSFFLILSFKLYSLNKRKSFNSFITMIKDKKIPLLIDIVIFYESLIILKALDN